MNINKRQLVLDKLPNENLKKLRTSLTARSSITCIEHLSNEVLYEIFDYLNGYDIYISFSNLNTRFQHLINCPLLPLKIDVCPKSQIRIEYLCKTVVIPNANHIRSIHINNKLFVNEFLIECIIDSSFNRLESIIFNEISNDKFQLILQHLQILPRLFSLTIYFKKTDSYNLNDIYPEIFRLLYLKYCKLSLINNNEFDNMIPSLVNNQFSSIEYLVINHSCNLNQLISILQYTPQLHRLHCQHLNHINNNTSENERKLNLSNLSYIYIVYCDLWFIEFELFIKKISSQLKVLRINTYWNIDYLDANRWEKLILENMSYLYRFDLNHYHKITFNDNEWKHFIYLIKKFISTFSIERKWIFEFEIIRTAFIIKIYSHKRIFNSYKYIKNSHSIIELTIGDTCSASWYNSIINKIKFIFSIIHFNSLHINCNEMFTSTFIKLILLLSNLNSIKLSTFPFRYLNCLSQEDKLNLILISFNKKILNLTFQRMNDFEQIQFILLFSFHIKYLDIHCTKYTNIDILIRFILQKTFTLIPHLTSLYLYIPNANEQLIYKLQKIIYHEKLLFNYTIQRHGDNIHLYWK